MYVLSYDLDCISFLIVLNLHYRLSSVMITRLMLNLRDPSFTSERTTSEVITHPVLTFIESHYPTQLSDRGGFTESELRGGDEALADLHRPSGKQLVSSFPFF